MENFINPYHFIPLPDKKIEAYSEEEELISGVINYKIITKSPLFIPDTENDQAFEKCIKKDKMNATEKHISYDFYSYRDIETDNPAETCQRPVIPGSELRGVLRSVYETLTGSCFNNAMEDQIISKRTPEVFKAGLLHKNDDGNFQLFAAEDYIYYPYADYKQKEYKNIGYKEGEKVSIECHRRNGGKGKVDKIVEKKDIRYGITYVEGYVIKGEPGPEIGLPRKVKHNMHIFVPTHKILDLDKNNLKRLHSAIEIYQNQPNAKDSYKEYYNNLKSFEKGDNGCYFPVYYSIVKNKLLYLSCASITREVYYNTINHILEKKEINKCNSLNKLCPACSLFGMTGDSNDCSIASKIRITDAQSKILENNQNYYEKIVTIPEMGQPKPSNTEFYLQKPGLKNANIDFWTYDYYLQNRNRKKELKLYDDNNIASTLKINGRKFYWHQDLDCNKFKDKDHKHIKPSCRNRTIRPVKKGVEFIGKVYFDQISNKQLRQLIWILNCGSKNEKPDGGSGYKIGMGKPLGFGSIECKVTDVKIRTLVFNNKQIEYTQNSLFQNKKDDIDDKIGTYKEVGFIEDDKIKNAFFLMTSFNAVENMLVSYPFVEGQIGEINGEFEGYKWFVQNHASKMKNSRTQSEIKNSLPPMNSYVKQDLVLPVSIKKNVKK